MASSILGSAMQRNWTPAAQLAIEGVGKAGQLAASMDKEQKVETKPNSKGGNSGLGGILGTGAGFFLDAMIPGMQGAALPLMAGGGALGGAVDSAINGGNVLGGALQGGITGGLAGWGAPELMGFKDAGAMATAAGGKMGIGGAAAGTAEAAGQAMAQGMGLAGVGAEVSALGGALAEAPGALEAAKSWGVTSAARGVAQNLLENSDSAYLDPNLPNPRIQPFIQQAGKNSRFGV